MFKLSLGLSSLLLLLGSTLAAPLDATHQPVKRDSAAGCSLLGLDATNDLGSRNFLLGLDDGTTVNPQGTVVTDPQSGGPFKVLGTFETHPGTPFETSFGLKAGTLTPLFSFAGVLPEPVIAGSFVKLLDTTQLTAPSQAFCAVPQHDENNTTLLAVNGSTDSFALCAEKPEGGSRVFSLVFKPTPGSADYDYTTCRPAKVRII